MTIARQALRGLRASAMAVAVLSTCTCGPGDDVSPEISLGAASRGASKANPALAAALAAASRRHHSRAAARAADELLRDEDVTLTEVAEAFPAASMVTDAAAHAVVTAAPDGLSLSWSSEQASASTSMGRAGDGLADRWRSTARGLDATLSANDPHVVTLRVRGEPNRVRAMRLGAPGAQLTVMPTHAHVAGSQGQVDAFLYGTSRGAEELLLLRSPEARIRYDLKLPPSWRLQPAPDELPIVEVRNARNVPQLRLAALAAWDGRGRRLTPRVVVDGSTIAVDLPHAEGADLTFPVLVDPEWQDASVPAAPHGWGSATLLADGSTLLAGGVDGVAGNLTALAERYLPRSGSFEIVGRLGRGRLEHTATLLRDGTVLVAGGSGMLDTDEQHGLVATAERYDPTTGRFSDTAALSVPRLDHSATGLHDGTVLIAGGYHEIDPQTGGLDRATGSCELYDPTTELFGSTDDLEEARAQHMAVLAADSAVLIMGGLGGTWSARSSVERFDPITGTFGPQHPLAEARLDAAATLLPGSGTVLITGGFGHLAPSGFFTFDSAELYDPAAGSAATTGSLSPGRGRHASAQLPDGTILLAGGYATTSGGSLDNGELYDPATDQFSNGGMSSPVVGPPAAAMLPNGSVMVVGADPAPQLYDLGAPSVAATDDMDVPRYLHSSTLLPTGEVLIVGGLTQWENTWWVYAAGALLYDHDGEPAGFRAASGAPMVDRAAHTATVLRSGKVLLAGGLGGDGLPLNSAELYDPWTGQFTSLDAMVGARAFHTATLLNDGSVLLAGGVQDEIPGLPATVAAQPVDAVATAELFDPEANEFVEVAAMMGARLAHTATLLSDGRVAMLGGAPHAGGLIGSELVGSVELFNPQTREFETYVVAPEPLIAFHTATVLADGDLVVIGWNAIWSADGTTLAVAPTAEPTNRFTGHSAVLLPSGKVLLLGGERLSGPLISEIDLYDPLAHVTRPAQNAEVPRIWHRSTLLPDGSVLTTGGRYSSWQATDTAELWIEGATVSPPDPSWRPRLDPLVAPEPGAVQVQPGAEVELTGGGFTGAGEATGGVGSSASNVPIAIWMANDGATAYGTLTNWTDTQATWTVPSTAYPGPGQLFIVTNGILSHSVGVTITQAPNGLPCNGAGACLSGFCVEGVCCEQACDGVCMACSAHVRGDGEDGVCAPVLEATDPEGDCDAESPDTCGLTGRCDGNGSCQTYADETRCGHGLLCFDGECVPGRCDGDHGVNRLGYVEDCTPFACSTTTDECLSSCSSNTDCTEGHLCDAHGRCVPLPGIVDPGCAPACAVGKRRDARGGLLLACLLGAMALRRPPRRRRADRWPSRA